MFSYFEPNFIEKFIKENVFSSKFWPKSKWRKTKIGYSIFKSVSKITQSLKTLFQIIKKIHLK